MAWAHGVTFDVLPPPAELLAMATASADGPKLLIDVVHTTQILSNFLSNAVKFSPRGGQVVVSTCIVQPCSLAVSRSATANLSPTVDAPYEGCFRWCSSRVRGASSTEPRRTQPQGPSAPSTQAGDATISVTCSETSVNSGYVVCREIGVPDPLRYKRAVSTAGTSSPIVQGAERHISSFCPTIATRV
jgi:hypothetical protein